MSETEDKPPSSKISVGFISRNILARNFVFERFKGIWELWSSDWGIPVVRGVVSYRRHLISENL